MTKETPKKYKVLFFDCFSYRHTQFRVRTAQPDKYMVWQRHCHNLADFNVALSEGTFDVMFIPGFINTEKETKGMIEALITLPQAARPKLLVMHGSSDIERIVPVLRNDGYLIAHVPWDFVNPMVHERKK